MTDFIKKKRLIFSVVFIALVSMITLWFLFKPTHRLILTCGYDVFMQDRQHGAIIHRNTHLYFYADGSGFRTESGFVDTDAGRKFIDRDIYYLFNDNDSDGTLTFNRTHVVKRTHDNAPDNLWGTETTPGVNQYITITEISKGLYLLRERGKPLSICTTIAAG